MKSNSKVNKNRRRFFIRLRNARVTLLLLLAVVALTQTNCSDTTGNMGIPPSNETLATSSKTCDVLTSTALLDSIQARSTFTYLGSIYDPETNGRITGNFITQLSVVEGMGYFTHPDSILSRDSEGRPCCDTVSLRFNFDGYYGDINTPLKLAIYPLDITRPLCEDSIYYLNTDLRQYIRPGYENSPIATKVFTAWDRIYGSDPSDVNASAYPSIRVDLPLSEGNHIMDLYWQYLKDNEGLELEEHVNRNFDDSHYFIRNVLPGYYAEIISGEGVMVRVFVDALYLSYKIKAYEDGEHTEGRGLAVFGGTPEVIQGCQFTQYDADGLLVDNPDTTWLKMPAGLCTEVALPIDDIYSEDHKLDSLSRAELMLTRYNKEQTGEQFDMPSKVLLVRKSEAKRFFREGQLPDNVTSFTTSFQKTYNIYSFTNIAQLISYLYQERYLAVQTYIKEKLRIDNPSPEKVAEETAIWTQNHPDWNKCLVVPIEETTNTSSNSVTTVTPDLNITSACLVRGTPDSPIRMQVYYTRIASAK